VEDVLNAGWRTPDLADEDTPDEKRVGTSQMGDKIIAAFQERAQR
jgi:3-isopropylmalate dehydrogenase